jgi:hypothetical protein
LSNRVGIFLHVVISKCQIKKNKVYCTNCDFLSCDLLSYLSKIESFVNFCSNALYGFFFINKCTLLTYGFVPDIMIILQKYKLVEYIDNFSKTSLFPLQKLWNSNATVKRKIKIFEESKIDELLNYRHWFYVLQTYYTTKSTNQKQELHVVAMFANRSGGNEQSSEDIPGIDASYQVSVVAMFINRSGRNEQSL